MNKKLTNAAIFALGFGLVLAPAISFAGFNDKEQKDMPQHFEYLESGDYEGFLESIKGTPLEKIIDTENEFEKMIELHSLRKEMQDLREELGLPKHRGHHRSNVRFSEFENYEDFLAGAEGKRIQEVIDSEEKFEAMIEAHNLHQEGDHEGAREVIEAAGIERPGFHKNI
jgi:hypothetical protein